MTDAVALYVAFEEEVEKLMIKNELSESDAFDAVLNRVCHL